MKQYTLSRGPLSVIAAAGLLPLLLLATPIPEKGEALVMAAAFALLGGLILYFASGHIKEPSALVFFIAALAAGMVLRTLSLTQSNNTDYIYCLRPWAQDFRVNGWQALVHTWSDYNVPYLYIIGFIAKIPMNDLYLYKLVSVIFDCGIVVAGLRLARVFSLNGLRRTVLGAALFLAPTVWLNSSFWGQCDSIYALFCLLSLVFILENKPALSVAMVAVAFSFKLQTVFFLPIFIVLWMLGRIRWWREALVFTGTFLLTVLPAWLLGRPLESILRIYGNQTQTYADRLNLNSPSAYALLETNEPHGILFGAGLILAFCYLGALLLVAWLKRGQIGDRALFLFALAMVIGIPWLLPSMHDRYFYLADLFCIVLAVLIPEKWYFAPFCVFASYAGYHAYLFGRYINHVGLAGPSLLMLFLLGGTVILLLSELRRAKPE